MNSKSGSQRRGSEVGWHTVKKRTGRGAAGAGGGRSRPAGWRDRERQQSSPWQSAGSLLPLGLHTPISGVPQDTGQRVGTE